MEDLKPRNIRVTEQPSFDSDGSINTVKVVSFNIGKHGPFVKRFKPGANDAATIQQLINAETDTLRIVHGMES